jgi:hypothetical protein
VRPHYFRTVFGEGYRIATFEQKFGKTGLIKDARFRALHDVRQRDKQTNFAVERIFDRRMPSRANQFGRSQPFSRQRSTAPSKLVVKRTLAQAASGFEFAIRPAI